MIILTGIILILILFCILLLMCAVCALGGLFVGVNMKLPKERQKTPPEPISEEQRRKIEQRRREDYNFLNYDGSEQEDVV